MRHKTKLIKFFIILTVFFLSGCESPDSDDASGSVLPDTDDNNAQGAPFNIDDIWFYGAGCPDGTSKIEVNSNDEGDTITFDFSAFSATANDGSQFGTSACNIGIPIKVPGGMSVGLAGIDHEGGAYIPSGGQGHFHSEQFFIHKQGPINNSDITTYDEYHEYSDKITAPVVWSECGEEDGITVRFLSSIGLVGSYNSTVEAHGHFSKIKYYLKWKECE